MCWRHRLSTVDWFITIYMRSRIPTTRLVCLFWYSGQIRELFSYIVSKHPSTRSPLFIICHFFFLRKIISVLVYLFHVTWTAILNTFFVSLLDLQHFWSWFLGESWTRRTPVFFLTSSSAPSNYRKISFKVKPVTFSLNQRILPYLMASSASYRNAR